MAEVNACGLNNSPEKKEEERLAKRQEIVEFALQFVGNPYVAGGTSLTNGADCSGFVQSVYKAFGVNVPRTSWAQGNYGREVSYADAQPGDVIYTADTLVFISEADR